MRRALWIMWLANLLTIWIISTAVKHQLSSLIMAVLMIFIGLYTWNKPNRLIGMFLLALACLCAVGTTTAIQWALR